MLQRSELLAPQASKGRAIESPVSAWWRHGGRMLNKLFDAPRFSRGAGPRTAPRRAGSLRKNHFLPVRGRPRPGSTPFFSGLGISSQTQCRNDKTCKCLFFHHDAPALLKAPSRPKSSHTWWESCFSPKRSAGITTHSECVFFHHAPVPLILQKPAIPTGFPRTQCGNGETIKMHGFVLIMATRSGSCTLERMRRRYHGLWGTKEGSAIREPTCEARRAVSNDCFFRLWSTGAAESLVSAHGNCLDQMRRTYHGFWGINQPQCRDNRTCKFWIFLIMTTHNGTEEGSERPSLWIWIKCGGDTTAFGEHKKYHHNHCHHYHCVRKELSFPSLS